MTADEAQRRIHQDAYSKLYGNVGIRLIGIAGNKIQWKGDNVSWEVQERIWLKSNELIRRGGNDGG